jgi:hypothetical protein
VRTPKLLIESVPAVGIAVIAVTAGLIAPDPLATAVRTTFEYARLSVLLAVVAGSAAVALVATYARRGVREAHGGASKARAAWLSFVDRAPWPAAVAAIAAVGWAVWHSLGRGATLPRILSDELTHTNAARAFADNRTLSTDYGPLTPIVHSTSFLLSADDVTAYHLIQATNVTLMILTAFPAYLLARRTLTHRNALIASALALVVPWIVYARFVMTEGIFYPVFLLFVLALVRALERPKGGRQAMLLLAVTVAFGVRTQAAVLPAAVVAAAMLYGVAGGGFRTTMRAFRPTWLAYALAGVAVAGLAAMGVWNPLGAYDVLLDDAWRHPRGLSLWAGANLTSLSLGLGVLALPAATLGVTAMLARRSNASEKAFAAAAVSSLAVVLLTVVVLAASPYGQGIVHERSLFYVAPLIFICALAWTTNDYKRSKLAAAVTVTVIVAMMVTMPRGVITARSVDALSFKLWTQLEQDWLHAWWQMLIAVIAGTCIAVLFRSRAAVVLTVIVAAIGIAAASDYRTTVPRTLVSNYGWIDSRLADDSVGSGEARATLVWVSCSTDSCSTEQRDGLERMSLNTEFFNSRISRLGHLGEENPARGLPSEPLELRDDGVIMSAGVPLRAAFVVTDQRVELVGTRVAALRGRDVGESKDSQTGLALWRVPGTVRVVGAPRIGALSR